MIARTLLGKANSSHAEDQETYVAHSLRGESFDASEDGTGRGTPLVAQTVTSDMYRSGGAVAGNNDAGVRNCIVQPVAFSCKDHGADAGEVSPTLRSMGHDGSHANGGGQVAIAVGSTTHAVRRLTPRECERLQGFPDDYTAIPWGRKAASECPDGPRYKALGNSMACNVMRFIADRIQQVESITEKAPTLADRR